MIKITLGQEPKGYAAYRNSKLAIVPLDHKTWDLSSDFRNILFQQLGNKCSYLAISFDSELLKKRNSIDHFEPKAVSPGKMYDWNNYRLCERSLNSRLPRSWPKKKNNILDPADDNFDNRWFYLSGTNGKYYCSSMVPEDKKGIVETTCAYLNRVEYASARLSVIREYRNNHMTEDHLRELYPGIYFWRHEFKL